MNMDKLKKMYAEDDRKINRDSFATVDETKFIEDFSDNNVNKISDLFNETKKNIDFLLQKQKNVFDFFNSYTALEIKEKKWEYSVELIEDFKNKTKFWYFLFDVYVESCILDENVNEVLKKFNYTEENALILIKKIIESVWVNYLIEKFEEFVEFEKSK